MRPRIGALFAGYGGLDMAVQDVFGGELAWYSEIDKGALKILAHRFPDVPNIGDVTTADWAAVEPVDILTGGSPCQDLSHAGKRAGMTEGTRSNLWVAMREAIAQLRPRTVIWENVRGAYSAAADSEVEPCAGCVGDGPGVHLRALGRVLGDLSDLGYDAGWHGLRAADVGAPHGRFRVFVVATDAQRGGRLGRSYELGGASVDVAGDGEGSLLPTPTSSDTNGAGAHGEGGVDLRTAVALLPTPVASEGTKPSNTMGVERRKAPGEVFLTNAIVSLCGLDPSETPPTLPPTPAVNDDQRRILDKAEVDDSGCWMWTGWTNQAATPYGRVSINGRKVYAHRASYEAFVAPIPDGHEIDHLCQTSLCVNPAHLEAVSPEENRRRVTDRRTHCKRGHEFTEENTYWVRPGARACRACRAWQDKVQKARRKGEEPPLLPTPVTNDMGEGKTPDAWDEWTAKMQAAHRNGNGHGKSLAIEAQRLLPTPNASDVNKGGSQHPDKRRAGGHQPTIMDVAEHVLTDRLLPTPSGYQGDRGGSQHPDKLRAAGHSVHLGDVTEQELRHAANWGDYAAAIARWEHTLGRPAPAPTMTSSKGNPQLSPAFVEWLMGLPAGWVTDVPGITRNEALKALGNGVVPQQAAAAIRWLLNATGVAA